MKKKETLHIYTRVSTRIQEEGTSLDTQRELGIKKAKELGYKHQVWNEGGASSNNEDLQNRPKMSQLLLAIEEGKVNHLFVFNNDRLSRNDTTQGIIKSALRKNDVVLYDKDGKYDFSNLTDKLFKGILDEFASYDNALRAERSRFGRVERSKVGFFRGSPPPFGYQSVDKKLVPHPDESKWVVKIFSWKYDGKSTKWIKSQLDKNGVLARRGNLFSTGSIDRMMENTHHIGHYKWKDKKSGEVLRVLCPPIVDKTVWDELHKRKETRLKRKQQQNRTKKFYLLRDLLVCGECGSIMGGNIRKNKNERIYRCTKKMNNWKKGVIPESTKWKRGKVGEHGCTMTRSLNIPITDQFVWNAVMDTVSNSALLKQKCKDEVLQPKFKNDKDTDRLVRNLKQKGDALNKRLKQVQCDIMDVETDIRLKRMNPDYDEVIYAGIKSNLVAELKKVKDEKEQTRITIKELGNRKRWLNWIEKYGEELELINDLPKEDKKKYLHDLVEKIEVRLDKETLDHHIDISFRMGLVGDGIQYTDTLNKSGGYEVVSGTTDKGIVISREEVQRMHTEKSVSRRWYPKKKQLDGVMRPPTPKPKASVTVE